MNFRRESKKSGVESDGTNSRNIARVTMQRLTSNGPNRSTAVLVKGSDPASRRDSGRSAMYCSPGLAQLRRQITQSRRAFFTASLPPMFVESTDDHLRKRVLSWKERRMKLIVSSKHAARTETMEKKVTQRRQDKLFLMLYSHYVLNLNYPNPRVANSGQYTAADDVKLNCYSY
ncbi:hypothetical protein OUZ56_033872 [Daphnia magna]|uniref:Uncharacterized protein n=1 Tax=Daphnia magna TaxID=35525 RepID=A0ABQ9ZYB7_9CRUS|nr:hypothetical protein OUZ56_033872 [Daphnia magna]